VSSLAAVWRIRIALLLIVALGLGLRLTYIATTGHNSNTATDDGELAHNLVADGRWFEYNWQAREYTPPQAHHGYTVDPQEIDYARLEEGGKFYPESGESVGSSAVLAGLWEITGGERYLPLQILQAILDALTALLVYRIVMRLFGARRAAIVASAVYALYPPIAWFTTNPYNDLWAIDFTVAIVAVFIEALNSDHRWRWLVACGLLAGVGSYFRPNVLLLPPILVLATIGITGWREALRRGACVVMISALLVVPWTVRNYEDFHVFIPATSSFWENMWEGLGEVVPNDFGASAKTLFAEVKRARPDLRPLSPAWDGYLKGWVVRAIERHPWPYLRLLVRRIWSSTLGNHTTTWMRRGSVSPAAYRGGLLAFIIQQPFDVLEYLVQPAVFLLAMLGLALTWRRWRRQHLILVAVALAVLVPYVLIHMDGRYVLPVDFVYFTWIGLAVDHLVERFRARSHTASIPATRRRRPSTVAR
jgi:4-amino-4-deoxy-L-arabinose transferase-like glycosyltransferase